MFGVVIKIIIVYTFNNWVLNPSEGQLKAQSERKSMLKTFLYFYLRTGTDLPDRWYKASNLVICKGEKNYKFEPFYYTIITINDHFLH